MIINSQPKTCLFYVTLLGLVYFILFCGVFGSLFLNNLTRVAFQ